ncbi:uncharacterized protein LOC129172146 isoform X3 [Dunckerocampus dactyliophorus]|uniref:uncharacterized protein LOC129172146 isoform X3 n=1 Tax=Dunckerocampus dactyliophorus TaxID=161453 RepID=UPI002406A878|nr:uncharacterized protein LOC129172146 isoform X3 [Dunckerocampus dactyliophorus]
MAISKNGLIITLLLATLCILKTGNIIKVHSEEQHIKRAKRAELLDLYEYDVSIELNVSSVQTVDLLRSLLDNNTLLIALTPSAKVKRIYITTVCSSKEIDFKCKCEEGFFWSGDHCRTYGPCDEIIEDTCTCIQRIPSDGQYCLARTDTTVSNTTPTSGPTTADTTLVTNGTSPSPISTTNPAVPNATTFLTTPATTPPFGYEYTVSVELSTTDTSVEYLLRHILGNTSYPILINSFSEISAINMTTVCYPSIDGFYCICEDEHRWPCDQCYLYGSCDHITNDTCGCITALPTDGQYCQSVYHHNFTSCPSTTPPATVTASPPFVYEYIISVELNTTDVNVVNLLRNILRNTSYPIGINSYSHILDINMTTVCYPSIDGFYCICEDEHRWSCDQCSLYGSCDYITNDTCGCINAIPIDGQYCQSVYHHDFTPCPVTTLPPFVYEYIISVELNTTDVNVVNLLRNILRNTSYPIGINSYSQILDINMTTVCYPSIDGFYCICEDEHRWSCDQCSLYGSCDYITNDTCGCINAIPIDGQYCQSVYHHDFTPCLVTTPPPFVYEYIISIELNTTDVNVVNLLRNILRNTSYPIGINSYSHILDINMTTDFMPCPVTTPPPFVYEYIISVELNTTDVNVVNLLRNILRNTSYPIGINSYSQILDINMTTVCYPSIDGFYCICEDEHRWSCDQCSLYGTCDYITNDTCGCINAIPIDGQYCQSVYHHDFTPCPVTTPPPFVYEYIISVELNTTDVNVVNLLRNILRNTSYPIGINSYSHILEINMTTVCYPSIDGFYCICEDEHRWSCDQCSLYGSCDYITNDTCGCINAIPIDGQYCQSVYHHDFTPCPVTTPPPFVYEYIISIELNTTDVNVVNLLRNILRNTSYPIGINSYSQILDINMTTVCYPSFDGFHCICEDQHRWSCDQCFFYGSCDYITNDTCGCINAIPIDGQYCQSVYHHDFTPCPVTTPPPFVYEYIISIELNTTDVNVVNLLRNILRNTSYPIDITSYSHILDINMTTVCYPSIDGVYCICEDEHRWSCDQCFFYGSCDYITNDTCGCINAIPIDGQYCQSVYHHDFTPCPVTTPPPFVYEYIISVELNTTDVNVVNLLRNILRNTSYPIGINSYSQILDINMTTVCYPSIDGFYCICEEEHRWSCDQCSLYGSCDYITNDTCGCINAIPIDGQYCQSVYHHDFTPCPVTTPPPFVYEYIISIELNTTDVNVVNLLRNILRNTSYPIGINSYSHILDINMTTVCYPNTDGFYCMCEDEHRWSCDQCFFYGSCDYITNDTCGCINAIPIDGQYCQSVYHHDFTPCPVTTPPPFVYEYIISVELNTTDVNVVNLLRNILRNTSYPIDINSYSHILDINMTTVCYPNTDGFYCICEDEHRWSCDQCSLYGSCDYITNDTCGCINAIPIDGQYCQSVYHHDFTPCPVTTPPPFVYEYIISVELNTTDVNVVNLLRNILRNTSYPIGINSYSQILDINMTTVCSPKSDEYQCICEDQYRWACDQCFFYELCDNITDDTCGCIKAIPLDGRYCQSIEQHDTAVCPSTTPFSTYTTTASTTINTTATPTPTDSTIASTTAGNTTTATTPQTVTNTTLVSPTSPVTNSTTTPAPTTVTNSTTTTVTNSTTTPAPTTVTNNTTTPAPTTVTNSTTTPAPTTVIRSTTTPAPTTAVTTLSTTANPPTTVFDLDMTIRFDKEYTAELGDSTSSAYNDFVSLISPVLSDQYGEITGFQDVVVRALRPGSVIAVFVVRASQVNPDELDVVNQRIPQAMQGIAPVNGPVTITYNSLIVIASPAVTYTGTSMALRCGPPPDNIDLGEITDSKWKLNGREIKNGGRIQITTFARQSELRVGNVILADAGSYECTLMSRVMYFVQKGQANIIQAPNIRLPSKVNVKCSAGLTVPIQCCVQSNYVVRWFLGTTGLISEPSLDGESFCVTHRYSLSDCSDFQTETLSFTCRVDEPNGFQDTTTMIIFNDNVVCNDPLYGTGRLDDLSTIACDAGLEGSRTAICRDTGEWSLLEDICIVTEIKDLLLVSEDLVEEDVPQFAANLSEVVQGEKEDIVNSSATISAIVDILSTIANVSSEVNETVMVNVLEAVDVIIGDDARESWEILRENVTLNASSELLGSMETLSDILVGEFTIRTPLILLNRTSFNDSFMADVNSSVVIDIPNSNSNNVSITTIVFSTLNNVLPPRNSSFNSSNPQTNASVALNDTINAAVALVSVNTEIRNITLSFQKRNDSLTENPQCVFWNFTLFDNLGAWDDEGCTLVSDINNTVTCNCNHLTSFSILMAIDIPESIRVLLDVITYVGVGISLASLVICLIIEGYVWKALTRNSTAFMRHVSIVNTALSLLIADICFIIAASYAKNPLENPGEDHKVPIGPCSTATFFMHFFYLALFFWMLVSGLLLLYRTVMVFSHMSKSAMLAIGFTFGYVCPLIIAVITVAVTAPGDGYIRENDACWLNWVKTKALLALVIPALTIVVINILIIIVVLFKMLRRGVREANPTDEKHALVVIARCVIILTPLFGLTWSLGVGTMVSPTNEGIHIAFAFFNSLQGFFILVFGTLWDSKIRAILSRKLPTTSTGSSSNQTTSTSGGTSFSGLKWIGRLRGKRNVYRVSDAANSSSSQSFSNT